MFRKHRWIWVTIFLVGVFTFSRLLLFWGRTFPLGDGGLFYTITRQMERNFWPSTILYNNEIFPFAYPPLAFWITTFIQKITHLQLLELFRILPLLYNVILVILAALIIRKLSNNSVLITLICSTIFIINGRTILWLTYGGGIVRGLGSIVFLGIILSLLYDIHKKHPFVFGILPFLAVLIHPEWGIQSVLVILVFYLSELFTKRTTFPNVIRQLLITLSPALCAGGLQVFRIFTLFGLSPLVGAADSSVSWSNYLGYLGGVFTHPDLGLFMLIGIVSGIVIFRRSPEYIWLFIHFLLAYIFFPRSSQYFITYDAIFMVSTIALATYTLNIRKVVLIPGLAIIALLLTFNFANSISTAQYVSLQGSIDLPSYSTFLSIVPNKWYANNYAEWLPVLTGAKSVLTVQGSEWKAGQFRLREKTDYEILVRNFNGKSSIAPTIKVLNPQYILISTSMLAADKPFRADLTEAGYTKAIGEQQGMTILGK